MPNVYPALLGNISWCALPGTDPESSQLHLPIAATLAFTLSCRDRSGAVADFLTCGHCFR